MTTAVLIPTKPRLARLPSPVAPRPASVTLDCPLCLGTVIVDEAAYRDDALWLPCCGVAVDWAPDAAPSGDARLWPWDALARLGSSESRAP